MPASIPLETTRDVHRYLVHETRGSARTVGEILAIMPSEFESIFLKLRTIPQTHAKGLLVTADAPGRYCLEGHVGPATLRAWGGTIKRPLIPVAWVEVGKSGVSYHGGHRAIWRPASSSTTIGPTQLE